MAQRNWTILLGLAVLILSGSVAQADEPKAPNAPKDSKDLTDPFYVMGNPKRLLRGADLTDAQVAEILAFRKATTWEREKQVTKKRDELWQQCNGVVLSAGSLDQSQALALVEQATKLSAEDELLKAQVVLKMRAVLTPEQLSRVIETNRKIKGLDAQRDDIEAQKKALEPTVASERGK